MNRTFIGHPAPLSLAGCPVTHSAQILRGNMRSQNPLYFIAFVIVAALVCIVLPIVLTAHGGH